MKKQILLRTFRILTIIIGILCMVFPTIYKEVQPLEIVADEGYFTSTYQMEVVAEFNVGIKEGEMTVLFFDQNDKQILELSQSITVWEDGKTVSAKFFNMQLENAYMYQITEFKVVTTSASTVATAMYIVGAVFLISFIVLANIDAVSHQAGKHLIEVVVFGTSVKIYANKKRIAVKKLKNLTQVSTYRLKLTSKKRLRVDVCKKSRPQIVIAEELITEEPKA